jgi:hypothetical protein
MAERSYYDQRAEARTKKTLFCQLECRGRCQPAVVLDLSPSGLFVRTAIAAPRGTEIEVTLRLEGGKTWRLRAEITRDALAGSRPDLLRGLGLGLKIVDVPDGFAEFVESLDTDGRYFR